MRWRWPKGGGSVDGTGWRTCRGGNGSQVGRLGQWQRSVKGDAEGKREGDEGEWRGVR